MFKGFRHDPESIEKFFEMSGALDKTKQSKLPYVVVSDLIEVVYLRDELLGRFADDVWVLRQWEGKYASDFFRFTVGQMRAYLTAHENLL